MQLLYTEMSAFELFDSLAQRHMCTRVANLVSCGMVLVWFPDVGPLQTTTSNKVQYKYQRNKSVHCWFSVVKYVIENARNEQYKV